MATKTSSDTYHDNSEENTRLMTNALRAATLSAGERGKVGIMSIVKEGENYYTQYAYNGIPERLGRSKCETDAPTIEESHTLPEVLHAEEMLVSDAAREGWKLNGATIFITRTPCKKCAAHLIQVGIKKLYYFSEHPHGDGLPILEEAGIPVQKLNFEQNILEEKYL